MVVNSVEEMHNEINRKTKICVRYQETKERSRADEKKGSLHGLNIGWFYKLPPYIVSKFYEIRFIIFWLLFGSK